MRFKSLGELQRSAAFEKDLEGLPEQVLMTDLARQKAFKINELVRRIHKESYEWYGFTIADKDRPELILDIGIPQNKQNMFRYTSIGSRGIADFQESLGRDRFINGWIHSHGSLHYHGFSDVDDANSLAVLDYVAARQKIAVKKRQILIGDLQVLVKDQYHDCDLRAGSVTLIVDSPVAEASILETVYGAFCYAIVVGDGDWQRQEIYHRFRGVLTGETVFQKKSSGIAIFPTGARLSADQVRALTKEVEKKLHPVNNPSPEILERT